MKTDINILLLIVLFLVAIDAALFIRLLINKARCHANIKKREKQKEGFLNLWMNPDKKKNAKAYVEGAALTRQAVALSKQEIQESGADRENRKSRRCLTKNCKDLHSRSRIRRIEAAAALGAVGTDEARAELERALCSEKDFPVRLYIANALAVIGHSDSIASLINSLIGSHRWYRTKVNMLIAEFGGRLQPYLPALMNRPETEIKELLVDIASVYISDDLKSYLFNMIDNADKDKFIQKENPRFANTDIVGDYEKLVVKAAETAAELYFNDFNNDRYLFSENTAIRNVAVKALGNIDSKANFAVLKDLLAHGPVWQSALSAMSKLLAKDPRYIRITADYFKAEKNKEVKVRLAEVLSGKIEYFILRLSTYEKADAAEIISQLLLLGKTSELIGFLNKNKDVDLENELIIIIREVSSADKRAQKDFCTYLQERLLHKAGLERPAEEKPVKEKKQDPGLKTRLLGLLLIAFLTFPVIFAAVYWAALQQWPFLTGAKIYVVDFNYVFIYYSIAINSIYLLLLLFSRINVSRQTRLWNSKNFAMLFRKRMLPGVSIIAPAYNEEKIIIESANSLLNLTYPDYELIVVNDGSTDDTLQVLIEYFDLKRIDYTCQNALNTAPIRGVYTNPSFPKLIVVDKENAGKADSLNAGIIISGKEYFCCIDSDSLLEDDALLKLAAQTLNEGTETPALGGNVYPINGCKVRRGYISEVRIPKNGLARFQTIEYIRAFMAGRLGWTYLNSLFIISGAFGLFRKERVIDVGGYLTSKEKYKTDTVGEDMELVVRIARSMREKGLKYRIDYCYNANCWTEVPEQLHALKQQRYRWQRGLIEILSFHRKTLFNPKYGRMGTVGMPYFFLFELTGPLLELQGYLMVVAAFLLGVMDLRIALLLFISSILMGALVSVASLGIAERDNNNYSYGDVNKLVFYAVAENFGVRQLFSLWRVAEYFKMLVHPQEWGEQVRKGVSAE